MTPRMLILFVLTATLGSPPLRVAAQTDTQETAAAWFERTKDDWFAQYRWLHQNPEVSFAEEQTATRMAEAYRAAGFEVTEDVGGHGVVAVLSNGEGKTLMLRCDMDALPLREQTALPYASTATMSDPAGATVGVMHACGHDVHMTVAMAVAQYLATHRDQWRGKLIMIAQPAEERGGGAAAMLEDGLFERFDKPDYAVALHVNADQPTGYVEMVGGYSLANVDSVDITMRGRGGHGSRPHQAIDPIAQAAQLVVSLQSIVAREIDPRQPAVVTVGSIHGGSKHNIISDECKLQLTVRSYTDEVRQQLLSSIRRRAQATATAFLAPPPEVEFSEGTPSLLNDTELTERLRTAFEQAIGKANVGVAEPSMGGEDFSRYGIAGVPICMYSLGTIDPKRLKRYADLELPRPSLHSPMYYPDFQESISTGFVTMVAAVKELMPAADK